MLSNLNNGFARSNHPLSNPLLCSANGLACGLLDKPETATIEVKQALSASDFCHARKLLRAYADIMDVDLELDGFSAELQRLDIAYRNPQGAMLLARQGKEYLGCVGWRQLKEDIAATKPAQVSTTIAEVKRMFVRPEYHGLGLGRLLLEKLIESVRAHSFNALRLEVLNTSQAAIALYRRIGFREIEHYRQTPLGDSGYLSMQLDLLNT